MIRKLFSGWAGFLVALVPIALIGLLAFSDGGFDLPVRQQVWLAVWWLLALGLAFGLLPRSAPPRGWRTAAWGGLALAALQLLSVAWGPSDDRAIADACRTAGYLGLLALAWCGLGPRSWASAAWGLFAVAVVITVYAFLGRLIPTLPGVEDQFGTGRLAEPLSYWNALAAWAAMTLAMALAWSAEARRGRTRAACAALLPVAATVIYLTYSRGGVLAAAAGVAIVIAVAGNRERAAVHALVAVPATAFVILAIRSQPQIADGNGTDGALAVGICVALAAAACWLVATRTTPLSRSPRAAPADATRVAVAGVGLLAVGLVIVALVAGRDGFGRGGDAGTFVSDDPSARLTTAAGNRSAYWSEAIDGFMAQPVRGEGAGSFKYRWATEGSNPELVSDPHSLLFGVATELGVLGLVALAALFVGLVTCAARGLATAQPGAPAGALAAAFGAFVVSVAIDWTWESTALASFALGCAACLGMAAATRRPKGAPQLLSRPARWGMVVVAVLLGALQIPGVVSTGALRDSERQRSLGEPAAALVAADRALRAAPWSGAAYAARAEARLDLDDAEGARVDALEAIEREPLEAEHWILLAETQAARDDLPAVVEALQEAVVLSRYESRLRSPDVIAIGNRLMRHGYELEDIVGEPG